jgi:hypothetical protein
MKPGDKVQVTDALGRILKRIVVAIERPNVFICKEEEYNSAQKEGRSPTCIGFKAWDVVEGKVVRVALSRQD